MLNFGYRAGGIKGMTQAGGGVVLKIFQRSQIFVFYAVLYVVHIYEHGKALFPNKGFPCSGTRLCHGAPPVKHICKITYMCQYVSQNIL